MNFRIGPITGVAFLLGLLIQTILPYSHLERSAWNIQTVRTFKSDALPTIFQIATSPKGILYILYYDWDRREPIVLRKDGNALQDIVTVTPFQQASSFGIGVGPDEKLYLTYFVVNPERQLVYGRRDSSDWKFEVVDRQSGEALNSKILFDEGHRPVPVYEWKLMDTKAGQSPAVIKLARKKGNEWDPIAFVEGAMPSSEYQQTSVATTTPDHRVLTALAHSGKHGELRVTTLKDRTYATKILNDGPVFRFFDAASSTNEEKVAACGPVKVYGGAELVAVFAGTGATLPLDRELFTVTSVSVNRDRGNGFWAFYSGIELKSGRTFLRYAHFNEYGVNKGTILELDTPIPVLDSDLDATGNPVVVYYDQPSQSIKLVTFNR